LSKQTSSDWDLLVSVYPVAIDRMSCITSKVFLDTAINRTSVGESNIRKRGFSSQNT